MRSIVLAVVVSLAMAGGALAQDPHPTFTVGTATASRGQKAYGVLKVPPGADAAADVSVAVVHGAHPGPVLAIVAGSHGTEYTSIIAVEKLIGMVDPAELSGTLILVPLVNPMSFQKIVPHVNPVDGRSMNGAYPGKMNGTSTERVSYVITKEVIERCDHLIDLHGGDIDENLRPYSYWSPTGNAAQDEASKELVLAFGLDTIIISPDRPKDPSASRFLDNTASTRGKASFAAEAGHSGTVETDDLNLLVHGSLSVMRHLKMLPGAATPVANPVWIEKVESLSAPEDGIFYPIVARGSYVEKGMKIGYVTDYLNRPLGDALAPASGVVLFIRAVPSLVKGNTLVDVGVVKQP